MKNLSKLSLLSISFAGAVFLGNTASAVVVWTEDFTGFTAGTEYLQGDPRYHFGFNVTGASKELSSGQWGKFGGATTPFGFNDRNGNIVAQPNDIGIFNMRGSGVFLSSSLFTEGSGVYQLQYDLLADSTGQNRNARIWVGTSSTHDQTAENGWTMVVGDVNPSSEPPGSPWELTGDATVDTIFSANLDTSSSFTGTLLFNYTAGEDVAIVLGTTNTDAAFDNFSISLVPEPSTYALMAGILGLGVVLIRRRRR